MGRMLKGKGEFAMNEGKVRMCRNVVGHSKKAGLMWMTKWAAEQLKCETFEHFPYSPSLAPSRYHLFLILKKFLAA
jgi:hypothetical protein